MKCPTDDVMLVISERNQIEIDYCPTCRGVWLDRGELDKIIEKSEESRPSSRAPEYTDSQHGKNDDRRQYRDNDYDDRNKYPRKKKRESFLGDLFNF